jgi:3-hydroxymyristoyl/3-hydroxydecanoyl-(acyl carrier protein) dehydratase
MNLSNQAAAGLAVHPWVTAIYPGSTGVLVLLNLAGLLALRSGGRQALLERLQDDLALPVGSEALPLRLLDVAPPESDLASIDRLLRAPRPSRAITLAETEREGHWTLSLLLPLELTQFDGHFPQAPVLPGVLQVAWALALAAPRLHTSMRCRDMKGLKFQRLLHPGDRVDLRLHVDNELADGGATLHFGYRVDGTHCSSGRLIVGQAMSETHE